jgi:hypothetical protein
MVPGFNIRFALFVTTNTFGLWGYGALQGSDPSWQHRAPLRKTTKSALALVLTVDCVRREKSVSITHSLAC